MNKRAQKLIEDLKKYEEVAAACNRCGFCTSYCPTYVSTGSETHSPRGRNQAFRALLEGKLHDPLKTKDIIETCLLCGECTSVCFSEVPTAQLMVHARHLINESQPLSWGQDLMINKILPRPTLLYWIVKLGMLGKKLGLSKLLRQLGILKLIAPELDAADTLVDDVSSTLLPDLKEAQPYLESTLRKKEHAYFLAVKKADRYRGSSKPIPSRLEKTLQEKPERPSLALIPVCGSQYARTRIAQATIRLLRKMDLNFEIPELSCCGLPAASYGFVDRVNEMANYNLNKLKTKNYTTLITDDSSCTAHYKDYPSYLGSDPIKKDKINESVLKFRELSAFLKERGLSQLLKNTLWEGGLVAYHDPCKAQYAQKIKSPPRELLQSIPGLSLVDVAEADQCCGGGGTYSFVHPEMSQDVLSRKIQNIIKTKCTVVVTSSASCLIQLDFGLRKAHSKIRALHISEFLAYVLGELEL